MVFLAACAGVNAQTTGLTSGGNPQQAAEYIIGPGDSLDIFVWHNADLSRTMPVRPDVRIGMPLVGETVAVGKTPAMLPPELQANLLPLLIHPPLTALPTPSTPLLTHHPHIP